MALNKQSYLSYEITEIPELQLVSYTQKNPRNFNLFELDNIYFKKTNREKIELIQNITEGNYIIFDTETTGLNKFGESLPFQIAAKRYVNGKVVDNLNLIINVGNVSPEILDMTGFKQEDINNGISLNSALKSFLNFISNSKYIIAHNAEFDLSILNNMLVKENFYLKNKIYINCSMQIYYTVYKHIFKKGIIGSSLDQLALVLFGEDISSEKRHTADYDVDLVHYLLDKIKDDLDIDNKRKDSYIKKALEIDTFLQEQTGILRSKNKEENIVNYVHDLGQKVYELYSEYLNIYFENLNINNAISNFLEGKVMPGEEIILNDEFENIKYYIKKNKHFSIVDEKYALSYSYLKTKIYLYDGTEVNFFFHETNKDTDLVISNEEDLVMYLNAVVDNRTTLLDLQIRINYLLKLIKEHRKYSKFSNYGWGEKGIIFKEENVKNIILKTINKDTIMEDIKKGLISSINDLETINNNNPTLIVEKNLTNLFNN